MESLHSEVISIVSQITKTPAARLKPDTDLRADLNVDSLQGLQIVAAIEKRFGVRVPDEELDMYSSVRAIADTVGRLMDRQA